MNGTAYKKTSRLVYNRNLTYDHCIQAALVSPHNHVMFSTHNVLYCTVPANNNYHANID